MQTIALLATLVAAALAIPSETYDPKYDNIDSQEIVSNRRLLNNYGNCLSDGGPCTKEAAEFKEKIHDALKTNCAKCTPKQRHHIRIVSRAMREKIPDVWAKIVNKHDPKGEYKESFEKFLNSDD